MMTISDPIAGLAGMQTLIETPWSVATLVFGFPGTRGQRPADFETMLKLGIFTVLIVLGA
jgi:hypothetical protein